MYRTQKNLAVTLKIIVNGGRKFVVETNMGGRLFASSFSSVVNHCRIIRLQFFKCRKDKHGRSPFCSSFSIVVNHAESSACIFPLFLKQHMHEPLAVVRHLTEVLKFKEGCRNHMNASLSAFSYNCLHLRKEKIG